MVHLDDLVQVADGGDVLDQHDQEALVVGGLEVVLHPEALAAREHAALADGRELRGLDGRLGLGPRIDVGHHDALRAAIERAVDRGVVVVHHAHDRGLAPEIAGPREVAEVGVVDTAVLAFEPDPVHVEGGDLVDQVRVIGA